MRFRSLSILLPLGFLLFSLAPAGAQADVADLRIVKSDLEDPVPAGIAFTYVLNVTNLGPGPATGIVITDELPPGMTFEGGAPGCSAAGQTVTCVGEDLPGPGDLFAKSIFVRVATPGLVTNTANVSHDGTDPDPTNDADVETTTIGPAPPNPPPTGLRCVAEPGGVRLTWTGGDFVQRYRVYRAEGAGQATLLLETVHTSAFDATATVGVSYRYHVTAVREQGESLPSVPCEVTAVPFFGAWPIAVAATGLAVAAYARLKRRA